GMYGPMKLVTRKSTQLGSVLSRRSPTGEVLSVSASDAETLSTSPVGLRRDSTEPSWVDLRVTSFIGPYMPISQERTTMAW
ncbi:MAG: hypothetical protein EOP01_00390, partial [Propionibacteriaceae bacterium]